MTLLKERFKQAVEAKKNDVRLFVWKYPRLKGKEQDEIRLIDATEEQLNNFYKHCISMLYNKDKLNPGRYILLDIVSEQRKKCNIELFLRSIEAGNICADKKPYPRYLYLQDLRAYMAQNKDKYPVDELKEMPISSCTGDLPKEFERISIDEVIDGCLDQLGYFDTKHLTFSFIIKLGVFLTADELKEFIQEAKEAKEKNVLSYLKKKLGIKKEVMLKVDSNGLNYNELRAMLTLKPKKYSELTTDQLRILRNKVLFKFEDNVQYHIEQWEERIHQIKLVAKEKGFTLAEYKIE